MTQGDAMQKLFTYPISAVTISSLLVVPFMLLELVNRGTYQEGFPLPLFGTLWLLPMAFIAILAPVVSSVRAGESLLANPFGLVVRAALLVLVASLWVAILMDQAPFFLGVQNCD
jgi:hypothetical protein